MQLIILCWYLFILSKKIPFKYLLTIVDVMLTPKAQQKFEVHIVKNKVKRK